jgi:hypothetical protein
LPERLPEDELVQPLWIFRAAEAERHSQQLHEGCLWILRHEKDIRSMFDAMLQNRDGRLRRLTDEARRD